MITLETPRLLLRTMQDDDLDAFVLLFRDPAVMASFGGELLEIHQVKQWVERNLQHQRQFGYGLFSIVHKADGIVIGDCGLEHMELNGAPAVELGYDLRSAYWRQGLASEAAAAVRDYAFDVLALPRLISLVRQTNLASARVAEHVGMRSVSAHTQHDIPYWVYALNRLT